MGGRGRVCRVYGVVGGGVSKQGRRGVKDFSGKNPINWVEVSAVSGSDSLNNPVPWETSEDDKKVLIAVGGFSPKNHAFVLD